MCLLGWPFPPFLSLYLCNQYRKTQIIYNLEQKSSNCFQLSTICLLWPCALIQLFDFLEFQNQEGLLRFGWEEKKLQGVVLPLPERRDRRILIFGPRGSGKSHLTRKLIGAVNDADENQKIKIGVKCQCVCEEYIQFLDVWDIPSDMALVLSKQVSLALEKTHSVMFLFDSSDVSGRSFDEMKSMHAALSSQLTDKRRLCVASKIDASPTGLAATAEDACSLGSAADSEDSIDSAAAERRSLLLAEAAVWSSIHGFQLLQLSNTRHIGIPAAVSYITQ